MTKFNFSLGELYSVLVHLVSRQRISVITTIFVLIIFNLSGQENKWEWIKSFGGPGMDEISSASCDVNGNVYVAGNFQKSIEIGGLILESKGDNDIFVAKFDHNGHLQWAKRAGGFYSENLIVTEYAKKIKVDHDGNLIVSGCFTWHTEFEGHSIVGPGNIDIFLAKYSPEGILIWINSFGSRSSDLLYDMDICGSYIYLSGATSGSMFEVDSTGSHMVETKFLNVGTFPFLLQINSQGKACWAKTDTAKTQKTVLLASDEGVYYMTYTTRDEEYSIKLLKSNRPEAEIMHFNLMGEKKWNKPLRVCALDSSDTICQDNTTFIISLKYGYIHEFSNSDSFIKNKFKFNELPFKVLMKHPPEVNNWLTFSNEAVCLIPHTNSLIEAGSFNHPIMVGDSLVCPDNEWINSYLAVRDGNNLDKYFIDAFPGSIISVQPTIENQYYVAGVYLTSQYTNNGEESNNTNVYVGKRKLFNDIQQSSVESESGSDSDPEIHLSPNPTSDFFTLSSTKIIHVSDVSIVDQVGRIVLQYEAHCLPFSIDVRGLRSGLYNICCTYGGSKHTFTLSKLNN